jgi:hypothetical protein
LTGILSTTTTPIIVQGHLFAGVGGDERDTLCDVLLQVSQASLEELLLGSVDLANGQDLLNTIGTELDLGGEEVNTLVLVERAVDERRLNNALLALCGAENRVGHAGTSHGHGESGGTSTILGLNNLITTKLNAVDELSVGAQVRVLALAEEGNNGNTRVTTNNSDLLIGRVGVLDLTDEARGTNDIKGGNTEKALGVVDTTGLENLSADRNGRVDRVGDDEEVGLRGRLGNSLSQIADDGSVGVEQVIAGHAGLSGHTSRNENDVRATEGGIEAAGSGLVALDGRFGVDVRDISSDTCARPGLSVRSFQPIGLRRAMGEKQRKDALWCSEQVRIHQGGRARKKK